MNRIGKVMPVPCDGRSAILVPVLVPRWLCGTHLIRDCSTEVSDMRGSRPKTRREGNTAMGGDALKRMAKGEGRA